MRSRHSYEYLAPKDVMSPGPGLMKKVTGGIAAMFGLGRGAHDKGAGNVEGLGTLAQAMASGAVACGAGSQDTRCAPNGGTSRPGASVLKATLRVKLAQAAQGRKRQHTEGKMKACSLNQLLGQLDVPRKQWEQIEQAIAAKLQDLQRRQQLEDQLQLVFQLAADLQSASSKPKLHERAATQAAILILLGQVLDKQQQAAVFHSQEKSALQREVEQLQVARQQAAAEHYQEQLALQHEVEQLQQQRLQLQDQLTQKDAVIQHQQGLLQAELAVKATVVEQLSKTLQKHRRLKLHSHSNGVALLNMQATVKSLQVRCCWLQRVLYPAMHCVQRVCIEKLAAGYRAALDDRNAALTKKEEVLQRVLAEYRTLRESTDAELDKMTATVARANQQRQRQRTATRFEVAFKQREIELHKAAAKIENSDECYLKVREAMMHELARPYVAEPWFALGYEKPDRLPAQAAGPHRPASQGADGSRLTPAEQRRQQLTGTGDHGEQAVQEVVEQGEQGDWDPTQDFIAGDMQHDDADDRHVNGQHRTSEEEGMGGPALQYEQGNRELDSDRPAQAGKGSLQYQPVYAGPTQPAYHGVPHAPLSVPWNGQQLWYGQPAQYGVQGASQPDAPVQPANYQQYQMLPCSDMYGNFMGWFPCMPTNVTQQHGTDAAQLAMQDAGTATAAAAAAAEQGASDEGKQEAGSQTAAAALHCYAT